MFNLPARRICEITTTAVLLTCAAVHSPELVLAKTSSCPTCPVAGVVATQTQSLGDGTQAGGTCATRKASNGYPLPDPKCTPGAFNPSVAVAQFGNKKFTTKCVRDCTTSGAQKFVMYKSYGISKNPSCELDHLVPLEMGGADSVDNIWPQCGNAPNGKNYKDIKDVVEQYLAIQTVTGMDLSEARKGIAADWTQYIDAAQAFCGAKSCNIQDYRK